MGNKKKIDIETVLLSRIMKKGDLCSFRASQQYWPITCVKFLDSTKKTKKQKKKQNKTNKTNKKDVKLICGDSAGTISFFDIQNPQHNSVQDRCFLKEPVESVAWKPHTQSVTK